MSIISLHFTDLQRTNQSNEGESSHCADILSFLSHINRLLPFQIRHKRGAPPKSLRSCLRTELKHFIAICWSVWVVRTVVRCSCNFYILIIIIICCLLLLHFDLWTTRFRGRCVFMNDNRDCIENWNRTNKWLWFSGSASWKEEGKKERDKT